MFEFYATFDYNGITHPDSGGEYEHERDAYNQWERELHCAIPQWSGSADLLGYLVLSRNIGARRVSVRFIVGSPRTVEEQVENIQTYLFDEGGLSCAFVIGRERPYYVTYETTQEVWALSPEQAMDRVPGKARLADPVGY